MLFATFEHFVKFTASCFVEVKMPKFATVRQIMLKQKRAVKCPFLDKFYVLPLKWVMANLSQQMKYLMPTAPL